MAFFNDADAAGLTINKMVFHLVGPNEGDLVHLEAINPGRYAKFFLDRIRSVNNGVPYVFSENSPTQKRLQNIHNDVNNFQSESEKLAQDFQRQHGGSAAAGAFLIFHLQSPSGVAFALLKYDDETVLSYELEDAGDGRKRPSLESLERTFVQNRDALQKSALVKLTDEGGELTVLDRRNQQKVARYFENFLFADRVHEDAELTDKLVNCTRKLIRDNRGLVPDHVAREVTKRTYEAAAAGGQLGIDDQKSFLETVVGQKLSGEHELVIKFNNALKRERIDGTPVNLDATKVQKPSTKRYRTRSGIQIQAPIDLQQKIEIKADHIIIRDTLERSTDDPNPVA